MIVVVVFSFRLFIMKIFHVQQQHQQQQKMMSSSCVLQGIMMNFYLNRDKWPFVIQEGALRKVTEEILP